MAYKQHDQAKLRQMDAVSLKGEILSARREYLALSLKLRAGELKETHSIRLLRRDIARMETFLATAV